MKTATEEINTTWRVGLPWLSTDPRMNVSGKSQKEGIDKKVEEQTTQPYQMPSWLPVMLP